MTGIWPASGQPPVATGQDLRHFGVMDGTGVVAGDVELSRVLRTVAAVYNEVTDRGGTVLISCKNGAHRSATLAAVALMFFATSRHR